MNLRSLIVVGILLSLMAIGAAGHRFEQRQRWIADGHEALEDARAALEAAGISGRFSTDTAPSLNRMAVAGYLYTEDGRKRDFFVKFKSENGQRVPVKVSYAGRSVLPGESPHRPANRLLPEPLQKPASRALLPHLSAKR